ncbi:ATP-binding protein [Rickettsia endosymbiont of Orchestes rusci]|uniref:ATP-binding protein n=1 Tax=Rickettsia endosymbiont of Orchestes rusci TaxID=3066250 RepID=UPI00313C00E4
MKAIIKREHYLQKIETQFLSHIIVALLGPRQCGKTTLAHQFAHAKEEVHFFDLEDTRDLAALENPYITLKDKKGLIIIDEIQRLPNLFPTLRVLADEHKERYFLILGSASRDLIKQGSETLAGRISYIEVHPFSLLEVSNINHLHLLGGFPKSYLYPKTGFDWLEQYIRTFLERDIPNLGFSIPPITLRRFWTMLAHYHGNIFNASEIGKSLGVSDHTIKNYLDILTGTFMVRQLYPWFENISKRQKKRPKIYFTDSGIFHHLIDIHSQEQLLKHPKLGASFEGFALEQIIRLFDKRSEDCYYWGIHQEGELDLFIRYKGLKLGFEFKFNDAPTLTSSMYKAIEYLALDKLFVIYPGEKKYQLADNITIIPIKEIKTIL